MDVKVHKKKVKRKLKGLTKILFSRIAIIVLLVILQIGLIIAAFDWLRERSVYFYGFFLVVTVLTVIAIINERSNPMIKLAWIVPVLVFPVGGVLFYLFMQTQLAPKMIAYRLRELLHKTEPYLQQDEQTFLEVKEKDIQISNLAYYVGKKGGYPIYKNSSVTYFPIGEKKFEELINQLRQAKHFIFMEYFIVEEGYMWNTILDILIEKASKGVEVRFMYDGMCSVTMLPYNYPKTLQEFGIKSKIFSPIRPVLSSHQNNRDHRKIVVIDGKVAFTGGVNLADEYINKKVRFGHWKDNAIMIKGEAVRSFLIMFLQMWNITEKKEEDYEKYLCYVDQEKAVVDDGFVMPYGDSPFDEENVGEEVYINMIYRAKHYVHIMTPYLILDNEMLRALIFSAKSGVDVKIIMPHIPDKWYAFVLAKTYYGELIDAGVKIYEYTPGFVHAKTFIVDGEEAVVGTINLDFRSLYLHFEDATYLYQNSEIDKIEEDYENTLKKCMLITKEMCKTLALKERVAGRILRLFAPLM